MMEKGEYWILDLVVTQRESLDILTHPELKIVTNRHHHGLAIDELVETLYILFQRSDLTTWIGEREYKLSRQEIKAGLEKEALIWFGLTPQGGERWEQYSNPN